MSLTKQHQASLRNNRPALVKSLQLTEGILSRLLSDYSLNDEMADNVRAEKTRAEKVGRLMTLLGSRPEKAFATFIEALVEDDQDEFALLLDKTMAEPLITKKIKDRDDEDGTLSTTTVGQSQSGQPETGCGDNPRSSWQQDKQSSSQRAPVEAVDGQLSSGQQLAFQHQRGLPPGSTEGHQFVGNPIGGHIGDYRQMLPLIADQQQMLAKYSAATATTGLVGFTASPDVTAIISSSQKPIMNESSARPLAPIIPSGSSSVTTSLDVGPQSGAVAETTGTETQAADLLDSSDRSLSNCSGQVVGTSLNGQDLGIVVRRGASVESPAVDLPDSSTSIKTLLHGPDSKSQISDMVDSGVSTQSTSEKPVLASTLMLSREDKEKIDQYLKAIKAEDSPSMEHILSAIRRREHTHSNDANVYPMTHHPHGRAIIINNRYFIEKSSRSGTEHDVANLTSLFKKFGYKVRVEDGKTVQGIEDIVARERKIDHSKYDAFIFVILSHGNSGQVLGTDDKPLNVDWITTQFDGKNCPKLIMKPKVFFIQACQGEQDSYMSSDSAESELLEESMKFQSVHEKADTIVVYATVKGYRAWRYNKLGSCFVRSLVYVFAHYAAEKHLTDMLITLNWYMSYLKAEDDAGKRINLVSESTHSLTRSMYFDPETD